VSAGPRPRRGRLVALMLGSLVAGLGLMLPFEATITRILGVAALFTFILTGVFLIADPARLAAEDDDPPASTLDSR
jgi:predicted lipid-binding transport protein (Tim44 family)